MIIEGENRVIDTPRVTYMIIIVCAITLPFIYIDRSSTLSSFGFHPNSPTITTLFTCMIVHGGFWHFAGNMFYLFSFGDNVEDVLGPGFYILCYLCTGVIATLTFTALHPDSNTPLVGASGAISGILGIYAVLFPRSRSDIYLRVTTVSAPIYVSLGLWFLIQFLLASFVELHFGTRVAFSAHAAGFIAGLGFGGLARILGLLKRHEHRLRLSISNHNNVLCPYCFHETEIPDNRPILNCRTCETSFPVEKAIPSYSSMRDKSL